MSSFQISSSCCAIVKSTGNRCSAASKKDHDLCGRHLNALNVVRYNDGNNYNNAILNSPVNTIITNNKTGELILPFQYRSGLHYNMVKSSDLKKTLSYYRLPVDGNKHALFNRLSTHYDGLLSFIAHTSYILYIQNWFRKKIHDKIIALQNEFNFPIDKCVNETDVLTLDSLYTINAPFFVSYMDVDKFIYGFDLRSIFKLHNVNNTDALINPYTGKYISTIAVNKLLKLVSLLTVQGKVFNKNPDTSEEDPKYTDKRRIIKVFQDMDQLDQYTNPTWFLDLNAHSLYKFYKEAEDIWNYRLNLSKETKANIVPPHGKVFTIDPKNVLKDYTTITKLRNLCLDVIEKLIYSAPDKSDRVNGCIYVLLALVIVNREAALAMPAYYTMVTGEISNANYVDILI